ncbi:MAG: hypothetical protein RL173_2245 [Fibrobacterota bacterium]|jgi:hypothetical protein
MRHTLFLVIAAASIFASPFHMGASWEWARQETYCDAGFEPGSPVCHRYDWGVLSASVIDSTISSTENGMLWKIRFVDTAMKENGLDTSDTAILEEFSATGKARWIRGSALLPFEPRPYDSVEERNSPLDPLHTWGDGWTAGIRDSTGSLVENEYNYLVSRSFGGRIGVLQNLRWDPHFGWVSGCFAPIRFMLISKDGQQILSTKELLGRTSFVPKEGKVYVWEQVKNSIHYSAIPYPYDTIPDRSTAMELVRWTFQESLTDSGDWMRAKVKEVRTRDGKDSISDLALRWNWRTAEVLPKPVDEMCKDLSAGFWTDGFGQDLGGFQIQNDTSSFRMMADHFRGYHSKTRLSGGLDSSLCTTGRNRYHALGSSFVSTTIRLLQVDDSVIRQPSSVGVKPAVSRHASVLGNLRELALRFPTSVVKVREANGSTQTLRLDQFVHQRSTHELGLRWLEVHLPNGFIQRGAFVK